MQSIAYPVGENLYLNITNRCSNECAFCIRNKTRDFNQKFSLWLEKEPSIDEIMAAIGEEKKYQQIVFCGYGEPLIRLDAVKEVAKRLKRQGAKIRIDTNGTANLFWGKNILPELKGIIDSMSISLNAQNAEVYNKLCRPALGDKSFEAVLDFIKEAKNFIPEVEVSVVSLPAVDIEACRKIAEKLGVKFRVRTYYEENYVK
ncbi:radical SAM protein [candidate division WOR-1 bacterium RIFOXYA12_FULL_52_29]|uniref:Radical SAM protein n=1 Tax=candidate division WOR-1 bacterium RIFOXYC12_FULL_54_18 TaxID=1802584 RepID=A0A1F4T5Y4_UNCSA|nr:MAG: radical SAM protein [candidate division WOR-1 bacterium RIFOXYA2_FULL_51_19]OGC17755.1 MAG: radical SAM protein [candidate division WOR-1 bacterium RIFOXYA12_FULL_52_29]OGC26612.1 MAG: radical SAM protein [candidate division WOR-1 bacterium RIFOXYB2_FULL_45_9]OGC28172.1 MAG: radical SAM protein [candidate division WOR-1 bacterium RIFOXYC12_FULL_54_18]OGC29542.1 MAG: radical SAM protein [candidate division WOR-1 bacterium RIFOXYB12_FULL_52_16]